MSYSKIVSQTSVEEHFLQIWMLCGSSHSSQWRVPTKPSLCVLPSGSVALKYSTSSFNKSLCLRFSAYSKTSLNGCVPYQLLCVFSPEKYVGAGLLKHQEQMLCLPPWQFWGLPLRQKYTFKPLNNKNFSCFVLNSGTLWGTWLWNITYNYYFPETPMAIKCIKNETDPVWFKS